MKNNCISSLQFYFSMFLSVIVSILFIRPETSLYSIILVFLSSAINLLVFIMYKGSPSLILKFVLYIYFITICVDVVTKLSKYMHIILDSGPYWAIITIMLLTTFFCTVKGFEALSRAAVIIGAFSIVFVLYILIGVSLSTNSNKLNTDISFDYFPALIMLFPSASYIAKNCCIKEENTIHQVVFSIISFFMVGMFELFSSALRNFYPVHYLSKAVHYGVFKGGDCLLLALLTISVLYILGNSALSVSRNLEKYQLGSIIFLSIVFVVSLFCAYFHYISKFILCDMLLLALSLIVLLAGAIAVCIRKFKKN